MTIQSIPRERYYNNQLLQVEDFQREQDYHTSHLRLQSQLFCTAGVLQGLSVTKKNKSGLVVSPGTALDDSGKQLLLVQSATFRNVQIERQSVGFHLKLNTPGYYNKTWLLTIAFNEIGDAGNSSKITSSPILALSEVSGAPIPSAGQVSLATVVVTSTGTAPNIIVNLSIDTSIASQATTQNNRIPDIPADKIRGGSLNASLIPDLDASIITSGVLHAAQIPEIPADRISGGSLNTNLIPDLDAAIITSGTLSTALIPDISADIITSGTLAVSQLPDIPVSKITGNLPSSSNVIFYTETPCVSLVDGEATVTLNWIAVSSYTLTLNYITENKVQSLTLPSHGVGKAGKTTVSISQDTVFTLTVKNIDEFITQQQLIVSTFSPTSVLPTTATLQIYIEKLKAENSGIEVNAIISGCAVKYTALNTLSVSSVTLLAKGLLKFYPKTHISDDIANFYKPKDLSIGETSALIGVLS